MQGQHFPLAGLESYCNGRLLYSPLFTDLNSSFVTSELSPPVLLSLYPAIALAEPSMLCELGTVESLPSPAPGGRRGERLLSMLRTVLKEFEPPSSEGCGYSSVEIRSVLFGGGVPEGVAEEGVKALDRISKTVIFSLALSVWTLQGSTLRRPNPLVRVRACMCVCV